MEINMEIIINIYILHWRAPNVLRVCPENFMLSHPWRGSRPDWMGLGKREDVPAMAGAEWDDIYSPFQPK